MLAGKDKDATLAMLPFEDKNLRRIGMFNDGYLGTKEDYGTWTGSFTREDACRLLNTYHAHPYGGEIATVDREWFDHHSKIFHPTQWNLVQELYQTHLSYLRNIETKRFTITDYLYNENFFDTLTYKFHGMPDLAEYQGESIGVLMHHHMGYRFLLRRLLAPKVLCLGKAETMALQLENTGFGMLTLPTQAELVFSGGGKLIKQPVELPLDMLGGESRLLTLKFKVPNLTSSTSYDVFLRVWAPTRGQTKTIPPTRLIRFANKNMWSEEIQGNNLGSFRVK